MESMKIVRGQVSSVVDIDFFLNESDFNGKYEDDRIAGIINGSVYERTKQRINDFIARCDQTLAGLQDRVNQAESKYSSLVSKARYEEPGSPPSSFWVDNKDPNSVNKYNEKVNRHNAKVDLHRRIVDQANRAKERYEDATDRYNEKKADLEEQIREKLEDLKPALDQDILTLLGKMQQLAYDNIKNKDRHFEGFLLSYLAKKAYIFLYDRIYDTTQQRAATDIFKKLDDELDSIMTSNSVAVKEGLDQAAQFLRDCHLNNKALQNIIQENLNQLPYELCDDSREEVRQILNLPVDTAFEYQHIIDPAELAGIERKVMARKEEFEKNVRIVDAFASRFDPTFAEISTIKDFAESEFAKMREHKTSVLDPVGKDIFFTFGIFEDDNQELYLKKHKPWIQAVQNEIDQTHNIQVRDLVKTIVETELLTKTTKQMLDADQALIFFSNKQKIVQKKQQFLNGINALESILHSINKLPQENSEKFTKKMSLWLNLSFVPLVNLGVLFPIFGLVKKYLPALSSNNVSYVALKEEHIKKFQTYFYIHLGLTLVCGIVGLFLIFPLLGTLIYIVSAVAIFLKGSELKKL